MWCPFCGDEMRSGQVVLRGQYLAGIFAGALAVNFEADDGSREGSLLLPRRIYGSQPRPASCCVRCEAVLVEPKSAEYKPPKSPEPSESSNSSSSSNSSGSSGSSDSDGSED
jgi:hypothetical protein